MTVPDVLRPLGPENLPAAVITEHGVDFGLTADEPMNEPTPSPEQPDDELPDTGFAASGLLAVAALFAVAGGVVLVARHRHP